jgi:bifunctional non-homologous end joining protein LigD
MALERYRRKRDFAITPEPAGRVGRKRASGLSFVVQKHAARRLHYDFRLELNGVLLSWAVPKGPSLDPNDKRLAMHVEDHPLEYGEFEGVIPPKQYGAGTVMVWDRGTWVPSDDPDAAYASGHLKFELRGEKLKGAWNLVRSRSGKYGDGDGWLLFKEADDHARLGVQAQIADDRPDSVLSGRTLDEIAAQADRVWHSNRSVQENVAGGAIGRRKPPAGIRVDRLAGANKAPLPDIIDPQLATAVKTPPGGANWVHEIKHDGYRMLCRVEGGDVRIVSRSRKDWTADFPAIARAVARLPVDSAWLDGEAVVLDAKGRSSFQALQNALSGVAAESVVYFAFDLLYLDGVDLRGVPLRERKRVLRDLLAATPAKIRFSEHFEAPGRDFLANCGALGLEGMVSKRADLPYQSGRSAAWQKIKCKRRQEFVVAGYTDPEGARPGFGALLLGVYESDGRLTYCGRVGTGFDDKTLDALLRKLEPRAQARPAFHNPPTGADARRAHWVEPQLVAQVAFSEWTVDGTLRHPIFEGLRSDKPAREVVREPIDEALGREPQASPAQPRPATRVRGSTPRGSDAISGVTLTNPDKLFYAEPKLTKRDLARYYATVGEWMLPHLRARPLTLVRCPNGWNAKCFYQKNADDGMHEAISRVKVDGGASVYLMAESVSAIVALMQMGALEIHPWGSRAGALQYPDRIVLDLDPDESLPWTAFTQSVAVVRALVENLGLVPYLKTTGGKGLHVVVPIEPGLGWNDVKGFAKAIAEFLERGFPDRFTSKLLKASRGGRTFIDYLRNAEGATAIAAYSLRAKASAPVATPIDWDEIARDVRFAHFNAQTVPKRLARRKRDPWHDIDAGARQITPAMMARIGYKRGG